MRMMRRNSWEKRRKKEKKPGKYVCERERENERKVGGRKNERKERDLADVCV